ncbi:MAG: NADH-quinone oxidoreductase subunit NuoK [Planctomycetaceae bacterium]
MTSPDNYLVVGALLFVLGAIGFVSRRNLIVMMLSAELMLHGVSLNLVAFSSWHGNYQGQAFTVFILTVAACEAGLALALILALYRRRKSLDVNLWSGLGEPGSSSSRLNDPPVPPAPAEPPLPRLTPAGRTPGRLIDESPSRKEIAGRV